MKKILLILLTIFCLNPPGQAQTRLGLHCTEAELTIWRARANGTTATNYRVAGDVQTNSPPDWTRILANANAFKLNTTVSGKPARDFDRFLPWAGTGCYPENSDGTTAEGRAQAGLLKDAAFVYLVKQDATYLTAVKAEILAYVRNPLLNFSNRSRWCRMGDKGFKISEILNRILFAYDYVRIGGGFTSPEQTEIQAWAYQAALWLSDGVDEYYRQRFVNRLAGNYTLTSYSTVADAGNAHHTLYYGSPVTGFFTDGYNNRILTEVRFVAMVAVMNNDAALQIHAKRVYQDYMRFGVFPGGDLADMTRWKAPSGYEGPETGLDYCMGVAQGLSDIADVFARKGDFSLYNYSTELGAFGTASPGQPKSLLQVIQNLQKYMNGTHVRYAYGSATSNSAYLINGIEPHLTQGKITFDTWFSMANRWYKNATIKSNYLRQASGTVAYPPVINLRFTGPNHPWGGQAAIYPGTLFMFGQLEDEESPYPTSHQNQTLTVSSPGGKVWGNAPFALTATASSSLTPTVVVTGYGTYSGGMITITGAGTITITVTQAGNGSYNPAPVVTRTVIVNKAQPLITFTPTTLPDANISDPPITFTATSNVGLAVTMVSNNSRLQATGTPNIFSIQSVGLGSVTASTAATSNYLAATATKTFNIVSTPVGGITDLLVGKSVSYSKTIVVVNDTTKYCLYQAVTNLSGSYAPTRYVGAFGNEPADAIPNVEVYFLVSGSWVKKVDVDNNRFLAIDTTITGVSGATQMKETAIGYNLELKRKPGGSFLFGQ